MKEFLCILLDCLMLFVLTGCGKKQAPKDDTLVELPALGLTCRYTPMMSMAGLCFDVTPISESNPVGQIMLYAINQVGYDEAVQQLQDGELTEDEAYEKMASKVVGLGYVYVMTDETTKNFVGELSVEEYFRSTFPTYDVNVTARAGVNYVAVNASRALDTDSMSEETLSLLEACQPYMDEFLADVDYIDLIPAADTLSFITRTLTGKKTTEKLFAKKDITVINLWATWCEPCIEELSELNAWELPDNAQIYYLCADLNDYDDTELGRKAADLAVAAGIDPAQVLYAANGALSQLTDTSTYPTTYFIDSEGRVLARVLGVDMDGCKAKLTELLNK